MSPIAAQFALQNAKPAKAKLLLLPQLPELQPRMKEDGPDQLSAAPDQLQALPLGLAGGGAAPFT